MQTPNENTKTTDNVAPSILPLDFAQIGGKRDFANLKMSLVGISFVLVLVGYLYHTYSSKYKSEKPRKFLESQEIVSKHWILGNIKHALEDEESNTVDEQVTAFPAYKNQKSQDKSIFKNRGRAFAKYKSIPTNNREYQEDEAVKS